MKIEDKIINWIMEKRHILFFICIGVLGLLIRVVGFSYVSQDMSWFLTGWFNYMKEHGGLRSLSEPVGNYNVLYQTCIACMTYIPINCVYLYKIFSGIFDFGLAFLVAFMVSKAKEEKVFRMIFNLAFATVLFLPTIIINSDYWGQCDAIYSFFVILTLYCLYRKKFKWSFVYLGIAFAFKLQTMFIIPFVIAYYFYLRKEKLKAFSVLHFFISILVFWLSGTIAYIFGRDLLAPFKIYLEQTDIYDDMWLNVPSFYMLVGNDYSSLKKFALILALSICGIVLYLVLNGQKKMTTPEQYINTACLFVWTCVLFLPAMHERYTYLVDLLLIILVFINVRYIYFLLVAAGLSLLTYGDFLFANGEIQVWYALVYCLTYAAFFYFILSKDLKKEKV